MQLSMRTDYALRALITLVENRDGKPIPIGRLASMNDIPKRFLEHIMLDLKQKGWARSVAGKNGGYLLAADPKDISMGQVIRHFDGYLAPIACVSSTHYHPCSQERACRFRRVFLKARNMITRLLDTTSLADVMQDPPLEEEERADTK